MNDQYDKGRRESGKKKRPLPTEISKKIEAALEDMEKEEIAKLGDEEEPPMFETTTPLWYIAYKTTT